jgi:hypothetical protein
MFISYEHKFGAHTILTYDQKYVIIRVIRRDTLLSVHFEGCCRPYSYLKSKAEGLNPFQKLVLHSCLSHCEAAICIF